ncbi:alpha/beta hydrolase family protein [Terrimonas pollutisoli]|uniref:alpha/beta hydrolase family protein n=1 Tax=Terrimonas pollutisoli TaxID=3034147 RepID=UPI0023EB07FF|nr:prolyl oligopeptidase family serine peptidase [Terrimonas sp. H1YJ31]
MKYFLSLLIILAYSSAKSQNGKIIEQVSFTLPDSTVRNIEMIVPDIKSTLAGVNFYHITYFSDQFKVKGYLAVPKKEGKYPCVIYNRGGNKEFGKITDESFLLRGMGELSSKGYVIVASQYRGNDGGEGKEEFGGKDVNDVLNLIPLLSNIQQADTSRIGMFGWSRGGMMTYLALTKTAKIKAAVVGSGITDLIKVLETRPAFDTAVYARLIPDYAKTKMTALKERSAVYFAEKINKTTPILILQGTADWRVPTNQVLDLVNKFYQLKQPFRFVLYEGGEHSLTEHRSDYVLQLTNWFDAYLRDKKPWPSLEPHGD